MNAPQIGLTPEQHAIRAQGVGASEAHDALFAPAALWLRKTGRETIDDSPLLRLGNAIEPYILDEYDLTTQTTTRRKPDTLRRGRQIAHLDAATTDRVVQCKWRGSREGWGEPGSSDIPLPVLLQVTQEMDLAGLALADIPVLFLRPPIVIYSVALDAELAAMIRAGVERFWPYVESDEPPEVNADAPGAVEILRKVYPGTNGQRIQADRALDAWRATLQESAALAAEYHKQADTAKAHLLRAMGEAVELEFPDGTLFRRKLVKRNGYTVEPSEYVDARFIKAKENGNAE